MSAVYITLGGGPAAGINSFGDLTIEDKQGQVINLGPATKQRIQRIQDHLEKLKIHAKDEG